MQAGFEVITAGIFTLIEDQGRFGFNSIGVSQAGAMDEYAYSWANKLLDNDLNSSVLEILLTGLCLKATADCMISLTGANLQASINDRIIEPWQTYFVQANDIIKFHKTKSGQRAYLGIKGGFVIEPSFKSCSTSFKEALGGLNGKPLKKGDFLPFKHSTKTTIKRVHQNHIPNYEAPLVLRVVLGYQEEHFAQEQKELFFSSSYRVGNDANRMAIKLQGQTIQCDIEGIISEGIAYGAIQIPSDGQPIILLKERQTIGGYPKIGSVLSIDCFKLSQVKSGTMVRFEEIGLNQAQEKVRAFYSMFKG